MGLSDELLGHWVTSWTCTHSFIPWQPSSSQCLVKYHFTADFFFSHPPHYEHIHKHTPTQWQQGVHLFWHCIYIIFNVYLLREYFDSLFTMCFAVTYIPFTLQVRSHQGAALQSVLCWWLLKNSMSKGLSALLQGISVVATEGERSVGHQHSQLSRQPSWTHMSL